MMFKAPGPCAPTVLCVHGDKVDNPKPTPSINKIRERAAAPTEGTSMAPWQTFKVAD